MKKFILFLIAAAGAFNVMAQNINPESDFVGRHSDYVSPGRHKEKKEAKRAQRKERHEERKEAAREKAAAEARREHMTKEQRQRERAARTTPKEPRAPREPRAAKAPRPVRVKKPIRQDTMATGWCVELNAMGGIFTQNVTTNRSLSAGYYNVANSKISSPQYNNGGEFGGDAGVSYFFGRKRHFGIGTGLMYFYDRSNATIDNFHVESQQTDRFGNTYRSEITADHQIKEDWKTSNFNIPILLKYKTKFSDKLGFTADAGAVINISEKTAYKTNAAFDYEAVYQYVTGGDGSVTTVYDGSATPAANDLLITKAQYLSTHTSANIQDYFNSLRKQGYNVGLGVAPNNNKGHVSYTSGSVGLLLRPAISLYLRDNFTLNLGVYYLYQNFNRNASANYRITDNTGSYAPMVNNVSSASNNSYGITAGLRYCFSNHCIGESMAPDTNDDEAPEPEAPVAVEPVPVAPEMPVASPEEAPMPEEETGHHVDISTPLLFDVDRTVIKKSSYPILEEAIRELRANPDAYLVIHGYTDNTGTAAYNKVLSRKRAQAVKNYLRRHGVKTRTIKTIGHGESHPAASNKTRAGRAKNRRAVMKLKKKSEE